VQQLISLLEELKLPIDWKNRILEQFSQVQASPIPQRQKEIDAKLTRLGELYIAGDISKEKYETLRAEIQGENSSRNLNTKGLDLRRVAELVANMKTIWSLAQLEERKKLMQMFYRKVYIESGAIKAVEPTEVMWVLLNTVMQLETGRTGFEPAVQGYPCTPA
jgi:hypothetical protein